MKTKKHSLLIFACGFLAAMICAFACLSMPKTDARADEAKATVPVSDAVVLINVGENANVTLDTSNPNGVTTEGIVWKGLGVSAWATANNAECYANIGNETNKKVALLLKFVKPIEAKYFDDLTFKFFPGNTGTLYVYNSAAKDFTAEAAKGSLKVKEGCVANTIKLNTADFAAEDGFVKEITLFCDRDDTTDWFFGKFTFSLKEEYVPLPEDFEAKATEDPTTSPITGAAIVMSDDGKTVVSQENANVNGIKDEYTFDKLQENGEKIADDTTEKGYKWKGGYLQEEYGYSTLTAWDAPLTAVVIKLKTPIVAANYKSVCLNILTGGNGDYALFPSTAKIFNGKTAAATERISGKGSITANAADLAKEDGKIYDITFAFTNMISKGQVFFKNLELVKADDTTDVVNFNERNGIISSDTTNPNKVDLKPYKFINVKKQTWEKAGMGLCTHENFDKVGSALVIEFSEPINTALYEKIEFTIYSGMTGVLEIYPSTAKSLFSGNAVQTEEIKSQGKYTFTMKTADYADADGMMPNFTLYAPQDSTNKGQIFFGEMKVTAKTQTSYLDELVLTEGGQRSITLGDNAQFISDNIPAATDEVGAFSEKTAVKVTGKTTFTYLKKMVWSETNYGNIHMRIYLLETSNVSKIDFTAEGSDKVTYTADVSKNRGWFDVILDVTDFLNEEGVIGSMTIEADGNKEFIFGGAEVEDKLRILTEKPTEADISELVPMSKDGLTFTSKEKVNYTPLFERKDMDKNIVKFKMKISDITADFNVMIELSGKGTVTNGIWFWFDKGSINMITNARTSGLPADIKSNEYFEVELGAIPYSVDFMPYGVYGYVKINGKLVLEANIDNTVQETGKYFGMYVHQTAENVSVSIAPVNYVETKTAELSLESGKTVLNIGDADKIVVKRNMNFEGREVSAIEISEGDSVTMDDEGYIAAVKKGVTVFKVTVSASGSLAEEEITLRVEVKKYYTVRIGSNSQQVEDGAKLVLPELTAPEGYEFAGLFTDKECTQKFDYENTPITEDITLYTGWQQKTDGGEKKKGCSGGIGSVAALSGAALIGLAIVVLRKKEQNI